MDGGYKYQLNQTENEEESPLWKVLLAGLITIISMEIICIPMSLYWSDVVAIVFAMLAGLGVIIVGSSKWGMGMIFAGILAIAGGGAGSIFFADYLEAKAGESIDNISVIEARSYPKVSRFRFKDGRVLLNYMGSHTSVTTNYYGESKGTKNYYHYYVAPIVPEDWKTGDLIPLWAGSEINPARESWRKPQRAGLRVSNNDLDEYRQAVKWAEEYHKLKSFADAPIIRWAESPEDEIDYLHTIAWIFALMWPSIWIAAMSAARLFSLSPGTTNKN